MDDNGNEDQFEDATLFQVTPKGYFMATLIQFGASREDADNEWSLFEGFCVRRAAQENPEASHAALVFDGAGGQVIGVTPQQQEFDDV